jgi:hypothetical protein
VKHAHNSVVDMDRLLEPPLEAVSVTPSRADRPNIPTVLVVPSGSRIGS